MPLIFVTGISGSGKSTIWRVLKRRGYEAYDVDEDGLAKWQHNKTGYIHPKSSVKPHQRTPEFLETHSWNIPRNEVNELASKTKDRNVFLLGAIANEDGVIDLFSKVIVLMLDKQTLADRIKSRTDDGFGKSQHEFDAVMDRYDDVYDKYNKLGYKTINSNRPINEIVDDIVAIAESGVKV
jgi:broad-specificity NMP kinase